MPALALSASGGGGDGVDGAASLQRCRFTRSIDSSPGLNSDRYLYADSAMFATQGLFIACPGEQHTPYCGPMAWRLNLRRSRVSADNKGPAFSCRTILTRAWRRHHSGCREIGYSSEYSCCLYEFSTCSSVLLERIMIACQTVIVFSSAWLAVVQSPL